MNGKFKVKAITDLNNTEVGHIIQESDYATLTPEGKFVQLEYLEENKGREPYIVKPGIYSIMNNSAGFFLEKTEFTNDQILEEFINFQEIETKTDNFFRNAGKLKGLGIDVATRKMLVFGPPGSGKSVSISKMARKYNAMGNTSVIIYQTEKYEAYEVKDFVKTFKYENVDRLIVIMEDVGGVEMEEVRKGADAGLLSLLDNQEETLKIPTLVIATTNFPETLMGSLTNRPGRFDDKIKAGYPGKEARVKLMEFFMKRDLLEVERKIIESASGDKLSPAHLKESLIRSIIHEKTVEVSLKEIVQEIKEYDKHFKDGGKDLGFQ